MKVCPVCGSQYGDEVKFCPNDGQTLRSAAPASDLVGQVIADRYHVVQKLGEGGMGQVYLAEHVKMGRKSAIKVMNPSMVHDPDAVARFNREASNASRITHPNVCAIYDFGETPDGLIYLAMEYIEGEPLTAIIEREGALPPARATDLFLQTAEALQAAHDLGIVHRDLKPDNIMVVRGRDGREVVKVVDFGIAKAVGGDEAGQKVTKTGLVVGTPEFMSPEQLSGDKVDGRSDLYSLALVFYQMLTGGLPFQADTVQEIMIKRLTDEPATLADVRPDRTFPAGLQAAFDTALARMPGTRYQQVAKFAADVAAATGRGRGAGAAAAGTRPVDTEARTQVISADAGHTAVGKTRTSVGVAAPPGGKRSLVPYIVGAVVILGGAGAGFAVLGGDRSPAQTDGAATGQQTPDDTSPGGGRPVSQQGPGTTAPAGGTTSGGSPAGPPGTSGGGPRPTDGGSGGAAAASIDPAAAFDAVDALLAALTDRTMATTAVRDSAMRIYNGTGVAEKDRAFAAYVTASALATLQDPGAIEWARRAVQHDPGSRAYQQLVRDLSGGQP